MIHLAASTDRALFNFNEVANFDVIRQVRPRPQSRVRADDAIGAGRRAFNVAIGAYRRTTSDPAVPNQVVHFDRDVISQDNIALKDDVHVDKYILATL